MMKSGKVVGTYRTAGLTEDDVLAMSIGGKPVTRVEQRHAAAAPGPPQDRAAHLGGDFFPRGRASLPFLFQPKP